MELADMRNIRRYLGELFVHDVGEKQRMLRAASARGFGLPGAEFAQPMPGTSINVNQTSNTVTRPQPQAPAAKDQAAGDAAAKPAAAKASPWKSWLTAAALGLASAGAGGGITAAVVGRQALPAQTVIDKQTVRDKQVDPIELELQYWTDEAGKVHFGPPTPLSPGK